MTGKPRILVVDDEQVVRDSLHDWFVEDGYPVDTAQDGQEAMVKLQQSTWDIVLVDIKMPGMDGMVLQGKIRELDPNIVVIIITAYASVDTAVKALKDGAFDYVTKPFDPDDLQRLIHKASEHYQLTRENRILKQKISSISENEMDEIVGESPEIQEVKNLIRTVSPTDSTVLIVGESGTGKELVARAIHRQSPRMPMPLVTAHCAGLPEGLVESELFGHEKGAYTGAEYRRKGKFELADGGTIFFDEIGDISLKTQIDLLRVLEAKTFTRVGGNQPIEVDFRVIAATNRDLSEAVQQDRFRLDLYYRINVFCITLPPLRDRISDIPLLTHYFLDKHARKMARKSVGISREALRRLTDYDWPGNVRELENAIERAVVLQKGREIKPQDLPLPEIKGSANVGMLSLSEHEKLHIQTVLDRMEGNVSRAARALEIDRVTLYNKIKKYRLTRQR